MAAMRWISSPSTPITPAGGFMAASAPGRPGCAFNVQAGDMQAVRGKGQAGDSAVQVGQPPGSRTGRGRDGEIDVRLIHRAGRRVAVGGEGQLFAVRRPGQTLLHAGRPGSGGQPAGVGGVGHGCDLDLGCRLRVGHPGNRFGRRVRARPGGCRASSPARR